MSDLCLLHPAALSSSGIPPSVWNITARAEGTGGRETFRMGRMNPPRSPRRPAARNTSPSAASSRGRTRPSTTSTSRSNRSYTTAKNVTDSKKTRELHSVKDSTNAAGLREHLDDFMSQKRDIVISTPSGTRRISSGRTLAIVLSAALALILVAPTFFNYLEQQRSLHQAQEELEAVQAHNVELDKQLKLWNNEDYVKAQARGRLGYVVPGEVLYVITGDEEGSAADRLEARTAELQKIRRQSIPWYMTMWDAVNVAGNLNEEGKVDNPESVPMIDVEGTKNAPTPTPTPSPTPTASTDSTDTDKGAQ